MRASAIILVLAVGIAAVLTDGFGAAAAATHGPEAPGAPKKHVVKHGPPPARTGAKPAKPMLVAAPAPLQLLMSPRPPDTEQCRLGCAQTYYFCLSAADSEPCSGAWTRCLSGCARTASAP